MAKRTKETAPIENSQIAVELTESEKQIQLLESKIESLNERVKQAEKIIEDLNTIANRASKSIKNIDRLFIDDLTKRYGFDKQFMYYVGTASNRIYKKPINDEIIDMIARIDVLDWRGIQTINKYFMQ